MVHGSLVFCAWDTLIAAHTLNRTWNTLPTVCSPPYLQPHPAHLPLPPLPGGTPPHIPTHSPLTLTHPTHTPPPSPYHLLPASHHTHCTFPTPWRAGGQEQLPVAFVSLCHAVSLHFVPHTSPPASFSPPACMHWPHSHPRPLPIHVRVTLLQRALHSPTHTHKCHLSVWAGKNMGSHAGGWVGQCVRQLHRYSL